MNHFMFKGKENQLLEKSATAELNQRPLRRLWKQVRRRRLARWAIRLIVFLIFVAVFGDFIANERPIYCVLDGETHFPVTEQYLVDLGWKEWPPDFFQKSWTEHDYESVIFPPIPYSANTQDLKNANFQSPIGKQKIKSRRWRHWLGTDLWGHDAAAGMVAGCRIALLIGLVAMSVATVLGIFFGALAGYFGDRGMGMSRAGLILGGIALPLGWFYGFQSRGHTWSLAAKNGSITWEFFKSLAILAIFLGAAKLIGTGLKKMPVIGDFFEKKLHLPLDLMVMRLIEILNSIPGLLLLVAIVGILQSSSVIVVMVVIGLIRWTSIARFLRAELLKVRNLNYIESARAMGFPDWRILWKHALPNSLTPVLITISFGLASAVLLESTLSFIGFGVGQDNITWGTMLAEARRHPKAWWLALFPGLAIFITVTIFNLLGEALSDALEE